MKKLFTFFTIIFFSVTLTAQQKDVLEIYQIQGTGLESPYVGQTVTTQNNIVTVVHTSSFYMQTPDSRDDNNPETSNGILVYVAATPNVNVGDMVNVTGSVSEYHNATEIGGSPTVTVVSTGNPLPTPIEWNAEVPSPNRPQPENEIERYEGMIIEFSNGVTCSGTNQWGDFWAVAKPNRVYREPGIDYPGLNGFPVFDGNPEKFVIDSFSSDPILVKGGSHITYIKGVVGQSFDQYRISLIDYDLDTDISVDAASDPEDNPNLYSVGTLNCHVFNDDDATVYTTRLQKLSKYIRQVMKAPDVIALQEVKNESVLGDIANQIHNDNSDLNYTPYMVYSSYAFEINVGFLVNDRVNVSRVHAEGAYAQFNFDGQNKYTFDRPPLVLDATVGDSNFPVTFIDVHLRSRNSIDDPSQGDFVRAKREAQAEWLSNYIQGLQTATPNINLAVLGDYNSFQFTDGYFDVVGQITGNLDPLPSVDPATDVVDPDLINLTNSDDEANRYSYVYNGDAQVLDHIVVSSSFNNYIRYFKFVHANSDYPEQFELDPSTPIGTSDHDGAVMRFTTYPVGVESGGELPVKFNLAQNYPNPFSKGSGVNPTTKINYSIPNSVNTLNTSGVQNVELSVYDILGRKVATLVNEPQSAGVYSVTFDASKLSSGIYFYTLHAGNFTSTKKMILMK